MRIEPEKVKGFPEFLPPESQKREAIKKLIKKYFELYGFMPIETPMIEYDELMRSDVLEGEDEAISDRFRLKDRAGRNLGIRYEFTFQLARIFKQNPNLKTPFKRYQIGKVLRDEPTSSNRFKEFTQCDIDIIGDSSIKADAECIATFIDILKELNIKAVVKINNKKLLTSILDSVKIQNRIEVMRELDKLDKIGEDNVKGNLRKYADANQILTLFKLLEKDISFFKENLFEGAEEVEELQNNLKLYGYKAEFDPFLARGLSYYTGNIFEIKSIDSSGAIGAGGRYDNLVGKFLEKEIPAVGISFGLERLTSIAKIDIENTKVILISLSKDKETIKLAQKLRKECIPCITFFGKPGKALEFANAQQISYAIFIGQDEITAKKFKLKDMTSGEEKLLTEKQMISKLGK
ncbi:histidine--tRNA ligase [Candidatus Pacearchaeota archaeon CG10_big_fil_rev_8_21_14_0_10_34_76]|nr:MAG: histidine--tRNA ligase [Candidatus Pacearchaeota archaeon CG10_big_fil_rev_8_21_14_0_10_34_76]